MNISSNVQSIVLQPITLCNLKCKYCYLPLKHLTKRMDIAVASSIAAFIALQGTPVRLIWHGGEPTAIGVSGLERLLMPFEELRKMGLVQHSIQTNGTLVDDAWCQLFLKYDFRVGVSLDGYVEANRNRVDWIGNSTHHKTVKGINYLNQYNIPFSIISVVHSGNIGRPAELYEYFVGLGCKFLCINIEEVEGVNEQRSEISDEEVTLFWDGLFKAWRAKPVIRVRELDRILQYSRLLLADVPFDWYGSEIPIFPTIGWNGDVVLLSPEFAGMDTEVLQFVVGNVLESPLASLVASAPNIPYVQQHLAGVDACASECAYFNFCKGGQASNKYFENGSIATTVTSYCRYSKQIPVQVLFNNLES